MDSRRRTSLPPFAPGLLACGIGIGVCAWIGGCATEPESTEGPEAATDGTESAGGGLGDGRAGGPGDATPGRVLLAEAEEEMARGDLESAFALFSAALSENPDLVSAHLGLGEVLRRQGDYGAAEEAYGRAAELDPRSFDAHYFQGLMLHLLGRVGEAITSYRRALVIEPADHAANLNLATAYLQYGSPPEALPFARTAAEMRPEDGPTRVNLGTVLAALDRHEEAVREYERALELVEPTPPIILNLAESLRRLERYDEMATALEAAIRLEPTTAAWERLGFAYFQQRRFDDSIRAYEAALDLDGAYSPAMNGLGVNLLHRYLRSGRKDVAARRDAVAWLRRSLRTRPDQPRIADLLSRYGRR